MKTRAGSHFLIHGDTRRRAALVQYLTKLNEAFVEEPQRDAREEIFGQVFGKDPAGFEKAWKAGVARMEPDPWFTSLRHLEWVAAALRDAHADGVVIRNWPQVKERMARGRRNADDGGDAAAKAGAEGGAEAGAAGEARDVDFPAPARVEVVVSDVPKLPPGVLVTHVVPNILLSWRLDREGLPEHDISFRDPPAEQLAEIEDELREKAAADRGLKRVEDLQALPVDPPEPVAPEPGK
jgi:hypothetical protein